MPYGRSTDDLAGMVKRRNIRALVMMNPIGFFYENGTPHGVNYEALRDFEIFVNEKLKTGALRVEVTFIPVRANQLEEALQRGTGDLIAFALVITPERQQQVAFTIPIEKDVKQVIVTGPTFGTWTGLDSLSGKAVYINPLSVNEQNLRHMNETLQRAGRAPIIIKAADKRLLDDDLLQMVNAGLLPATVTTQRRAKLWASVLPHLVPHPELLIATGEQTAWAVRKNNPDLKQLLDEFIAPRALGTSFGNTLLRRYLENIKWVQGATSEQEIKKFRTLSALFQKYATQYGFDYRLLMAQGFQESMLEQGKRSPGGAVGIMQVKPKYAAAPPINIADVSTAEGNIHAGVKMLRNIENQYFNDPEMDPLDRSFFAFASYNAGPNRIEKLREQARREGLDANQWFDNVELVAAREIGQVTVTYVRNVYKYYVAYKLATEPVQNQQEAKQGRDN